MFREILFVLGISNWCKVKGVARHFNEGFKRPLLKCPPILHTVHEGLDWELVD
jgi:hypothetical protein